MKLENVLCSESIYNLISVDTCIGNIVYCIQPVLAYVLSVQILMSVQTDLMGAQGSVLTPLDPTTAIVLRVIPVSVEDVSVRRNIPNFG